MASIAIRSAKHNHGHAAARVLAWLATATICSHIRLCIVLAREMKATKEAAKARGMWRIIGVWSVHSPDMRQNIAIVSRIGTSADDLLVARAF